MSSVKEIEANELQSRISAGEKMLLLDIRTDAEVKEGALPHAKHLAMHMVPLQIQDLPKDQEIILYCRSGARSYHTCQYLMQQGVENVTNLRGGIIAWGHSGYEIGSLEQQ